MENIKLFCVSLGCDKNLVDTEKMLGLLNGLGLTFTDDETEADVILVNTCCFIGDAKEESVNTILEMARYREEGRCRALIVAGCLAQRYKQEILDEIPEVDAILGTTSYEEIAKVLEQVLEGEDNTHIACFHGLEELPDAKAKRVVTTGGYYAFLKISEGCDKRCTYCIIPYLRGPYRSVPIEELVEEASQLARDGVKELILVAQETTLYGKDIYGEKSLPRLLHELGKIPGIQWIRIQYCYPEEITDELIEAIRTEEKVCHYLDIPIQHASDRILKRMGRKTNRAELTERIGSLRRAVPDIALRTTLISGFPGETESDHEELMDFVNEMEFERLGVFTYSAEEDTPAYSYPDQVPQELKEERRGELMELQQDIAFEHCENMVGQVLTVLIEGKVVDEPVYVGRTYMDAPNVDGMIFVSTDTVSRSGQAGNGVELMSGDFVRVKVTGAAEYDLIGEVYDESTQ
ncbi:30S ribosomal protein S12 methylthiotransferase RimO [Enterocloster citroniae]